MTRVADFLNIQFDEILTRPTNLGNTWGGNSSIMTGFQAVQSERIGKWETELTPPERRLFEYFFRRYLGQWGYAIKEEKTPKAKIVTAAVKTAISVFGCCYAFSLDTTIHMRKTIYFLIGLDFLSLILLYLQRRAFIVFSFLCFSFFI